MDRAQELYREQYIQLLKRRYNVSLIRRKPFVPLSPKIPTKTNVPPNYKDFTKNQLVELLWSIGIKHNKRQVRTELIALVEEYLIKEGK